MVLVQNNNHPKSTHKAISIDVLRVILICLLTSQIIASCGQDLSRVDQTDSIQKITLTKEMIDDVINNQSIQCTNNYCPHGLARIMVLNKKNANESLNCSGFLIANDLLLTNAHCLDVGSTKDACEGLYALFPDHRGNIEKARCQNVLINSKRTRANSGLIIDDLALIQLDRNVGLNYFNINQKQMSGTIESLRTFVIDHIDAYNARIVSFNCQATSGQYNSELMLHNCPVISGNSGAPLFNERHEIRGIIFASHKNIEVDARTPLVDRLAVDSTALGLSSERIWQLIAPKL